MKKYYSPTNDYRRYRPKLFYRFLNFFLRRVVGNNEVIWRTDKPDDSVVFVANHTRTYAPLSVVFNFDRVTRPWSNAHMLYYRNGIKLMYNKIAYDFKPKWLRKIILITLMPFVNIYFRSLDPIPVYHDLRLKTTFRKTNETLKSGIDVIIYPERNIEPPYKYVNELEPGFVHLAYHYYNNTGKCVKFYPVYVAQSLKKILVGEPITYDPNIDIKQQRTIIVKYLIEKINDLGDTLPEHKVHYNKVYPPEVNAFHF